MRISIAALFMCQKLMTALISTEWINKLLHVYTIENSAIKNNVLITCNNMNKSQKSIIVKKARHTSTYGMIAFVKKFKNGPANL